MLRVLWTRDILNKRDFLFLSNKKKDVEWFFTISENQESHLNL